jgi:HAD superfamily hydrolase (TIGR01549 family)
MRLRGLREPDEHSILSFDFWDTIVVNLESPRDRWVATMQALIMQFKLEQDVETYEIWFEKISKSLRRLNQENGHDLEFKAISAWNFLSSLIFTEFSERVKFVSRAQEIYFQKAVSGTKLNQYFQDFYSVSKNKDRIIVTSDYEFSKNFIFGLLQEKGIEFPLSNIYVSSDYLASKFSGNLYYKLIGFYPKKKIIHIGDDFKSDFMMARRSGLETIYHARLGRTVARKLLFLKSKYFAQLKKLPLRMSTFKNDVNLLSSSVFQFKSYVESNVLPGDLVYFLGSEGAFFSNAFSDEFHLNNMSRCLNLGRKEILSEVFPIDPDYVFTILLLEEFSTFEILKYLNSFTTITESELANSLNSNFQKFRVLRNQNRLQKFLDRIEPSLDSKNRIVTVDIGYKATFSAAFSRIQASKVMACQLLGFQQIQKTLNLHVKTLQEVKIPVHGRPFSTKYLEILLGTGPRNEFSYHPVVVEVQNKILNQESKRKIKVLKLVKFSRFPSKRIRQAIIRDRFDDLRMEKETDEPSNSA